MARWVQGATTIMKDFGSNPLTCRLSFAPHVNSTKLICPLTKSGYPTVTLKRVFKAGVSRDSTETKCEVNFGFKIEKKWRSDLPSLSVYFKSVAESSRRQSKRQS